MRFPNYDLEPLVVITPISLESIGGCHQYGGTALGNFAGAAWAPLANVALYFPFTVTKPVTATQMFCVNGAAVNGNVDVGIYSADGTRLVSIGPTAQTGTSAIQAFNITDTTFGPGLFYMAMVSSGDGTERFHRGTVGVIPHLVAAGCAQQGSAGTLPATATFATIAFNYVPLFGLTTRSVI